MKKDSKPILRAETTGLLVIAAIILAIAMIRWGAHVPWGAR